MAERVAEKVVRVKMLQSQAGYSPVEVEGQDGKPKIVPGPMYTREVGVEYDIPEPEVSRLIASGICVRAQMATAKAG